MKTKMLALLLIPVLGFFNNSFAQDKEKAKNISSVVWFGIDFTAAKFTLITEDPAIVINKYLQSINTVILTEPEKYDIKRFFYKSEVIKNIDLVNEYNSKIDPGTFITSNDHKIDQETIKNIIAKYDVQGKPGTGLLFIAENLNKVTQTGSFYVVFFDIPTKEIIDSRRMVGEAGGFGFRNYWAGAVFKIMEVWLK
jgi:hypothetical protein